MRVRYIHIKCHKCQTNKSSVTEQRPAFCQRWQKKKNKMLWSANVYFSEPDRFAIRPLNCSFFLVVIFNQLSKPSYVNGIRNCPATSCGLARKRIYSTPKLVLIFPSPGLTNLCKLQSVLAILSLQARNFMGDYFLLTYLIMISHFLKNYLKTDALKGSKLFPLRTVPKLRPVPTKNKKWIVEISQIFIRKMSSRAMEKSFISHRYVILMVRWNFDQSFALRYYHSVANVVSRRTDRLCWFSTSFKRDAIFVAHCTCRLFLLYTKPHPKGVFFRNKGLPTHEINSVLLEKTTINEGGNITYRVGYHSR